MPSTNTAAAVSFGYQSIEDAFPVLDCFREPLLSNYIVQVRRAVRRTKGGILIDEGSRKIEAANSTVGKVVAIGPLCFKDRDAKEWPEGPSFAIGDFLQIPRFGGLRFSVKYHDEAAKETEEVDFVIFDHLQQVARITCDPREITSYV